MSKNNSTTSTPIKKESGRASTSGGIISLVGLAMAGIGSLLVRANYHDKSVTTTAEKVGDAVANGTVHIFSVLIGVPFLVGGFALAVIATILTVLRLRKVKSTGILFSVLWIVLSAWTIKIVISTFTLIKANPSA